MTTIQELLIKQSEQLKEVKQLLSQIERNNKKLGTQYKKLPDNQINLPIGTPKKETIDCENKNPLNAPIIKPVETRNEKKIDEMILNNLPPLKPN